MKRKSKPSSLRCECCGKLRGVYTNGRLMPCYCGKHGPNAVGMHECSYEHCDKSFNTPQGLAVHIGRVHTKVIRADYWAGYTKTTARRCRVVSD